MKQAKRYPFYAVNRRRFRLHYQNQSSRNTPAERLCRRWMWQALIETGHHAADIGLVFLDESEARGYNRDYRQKDYATNVLSFALDEDGGFGTDSTALHGDLILCPQVVEREAAEQGKSTEAHYAHLLVHGTLHLAGYDHTGDEEAEEMEALETRLMEQLGYTDPYRSI